MAHGFVPLFCRDTKGPNTQSNRNSLSVCVSVFQRQTFCHSNNSYLHIFIFTLRFGPSVCPSIRLFVPNSQIRLCAQCSRVCYRQTYAAVVDLSSSLKWWPLINNRRSEYCVRQTNSDCFAMARVVGQGGGWALFTIFICLRVYFCKIRSLVFTAA